MQNRKGSVRAVQSQAQQLRVELSHVESELLRLGWESKVPTTDLGEQYHQYRTNNVNHPSGSARLERIVQLSHRIDVTVAERYRLERRRKEILQMMEPLE